jgi:hypothetical protein
MNKLDVSTKNKKTNSFFVITKFNESIEWVKEYTNNYLIYNKSKSIENDSHVINVPNIGGNIKDIFEFAYTYYDNLPKFIIFCQAIPWDHCKKEIFDNLINNTEFTPLEYCGNIPSNNWEKRTFDGKFLEINNSWYISQINNLYNQKSKYYSFDEFMNHYFENYSHVNYVRFAPGSQYVVSKKNILHYPKSFWKTVSEELTTTFSAEAHIIERSMWYILNNTYTLRKEFYE